MKCLNNLKALESDSIQSEHVDKQLSLYIVSCLDYKQILKGKCTLSSWNKAIIISLHKKEDKTVCENHKFYGLTQLVKYSQNNIN